MLLISHCAQGNMALGYAKLQNFAAALQLATEVLKSSVSKLGTEHPKTLKAERIVNRLQLAIDIESIDIAS